MEEFVRLILSEAHSLKGGMSTSDRAGLGAFRNVHYVASLARTDGLIH